MSEGGKKERQQRNLRKMYSRKVNLIYRSQLKDDK